MSDVSEVYKERDMLVSAFVKLAVTLGWPAWLGRHVGGEWEDDWRNVVFCETPRGQVSWHVHDSEIAWFAFLELRETPWDGHTTEEKYARLMAIEVGA